MKLCVLALVALVAVVTARPDRVLDLDLDDIHHDLSIADDTSVTGTYSWTSPEGEKYFVRYVADDDGYRVIESNAVPATLGGTAANGAQGAFGSSEEDDDDSRFDFD
ncbi:larval cuticle protein 2-like [Eriocheir sinensis]|uniref:larval cuticle protein 2-like n=1 Tax=Eriocheir sinensis TaxID=95602 RepID=UPI0021C5F005|nr:larval cuticle protein 2-like [Eriocheir sinensis]